MSPPRRAAEVILEATAAGERAKKQAGVQSHFRKIKNERSWIWTPPDYKDEATLELERKLGPAPDLDEVDADVPAKLSDAGRAVLEREKLEWAEGVLKARVKGLGAGLE